MKRKWLIGLALVMCLSFAGCDSSDDEEVDAKTEEVKESKEEKKAIEVGIPTNVKAVIDGSTAMVEWDNVENATGYEYEFCSFIPAEKRNTNSCTIVTLDDIEGNVTFKVRAYNDTEPVVIYSDWAILEMERPTVNLENLSLFGASTLSLNRFKEWLEVNQLEYELVEQDDCYIYCLRKPDPDNKGTWNKIKRSGAAAWKSFWKGFSETVDNETADGETIVKGILQNRGVKNYIKDVDDSAMFEGGWRAIKTAWNAMKIEAEFVYYYYFPKDASNRACFLMERHFLQKNHEDYYIKTRNEKLETRVIDGDTYYTYVEKESKRNINFAIGKETVQGVDRWVDYVFADYLYFEQ